MSQHNCNVVLKYCELIDEFIKVRIFSDDDISELLYVKSIPNKKAYQQLVINSCIVNYHDEVLTLFKKVNRVYKLEALEELLYQICVEVNPHLEIHQVALPIEDEDEQFGALHLIQNPSEQSQKEFQKKILELESRLGREIIGQSEAVHTVANAVKKAAAGLKAPNKPIGVFLLVGSTGTGKTETAKATARHLFGDLTKLVRVDCSEYALPHEYAKLIGAPPGYIGHNEGGVLTESVREKKGCVVLFDEIEKAHFKVHNLLLQIMDEGFLTDNKGSVVGFNRTLIFLTSNIGVDEVERIRNRMGFDARKRKVLDRKTLREAIATAMKDTFTPEFINRLDDMLVFNNLTRKDCLRIARNQLEEVASYLKNSGIHLSFSKKVDAFVVERGYSAEYGARELRRIIQKEIENPLSELIITGHFREGDHVQVEVNRRRVAFKVRKKKTKATKSTSSASSKGPVPAKAAEKTLPVRT